MAADSHNAHPAGYPAPMVFYGNAGVRARLSASSATGRLHHCLLFEGPDGVGKATFALRFAMELNCQADQQPAMFGPPTPVERPCGTCDACRWTLAGTHPDISIVRPDPDRATPIISADQARDVVRSVALTRHSANYRVVIIDPADALNEEAANALLKTLEEPPSGTMFLLVTSRPAALLQTVRSRSQRVRFGPLDAASMHGWLNERGLDSALASAGSPGRALLLHGGEAQQRDVVLDAVVGVIGQPLGRLFAFTESLTKKDIEPELVLDVLEELFADCVRLRAGADLRHAERQAVLSRWSRALWPDGLARLQGQLGNARERLRLNVQGKVVLDALLSSLNLELSQVRS